MKLGLVWAVAASAIGSGFQHGYNTGVVNSPQKVMVEWTKSVLKNPSDQNVELYWSVIVSIFCIGGMLGGALTSVMSNRFGRKGALLLNNILVFIAAGLMFTSKYLSNVYMLIGGRFVIGVNAGLNAGLAPTYLNEISPVNKRGAIGSVYQLVITITILIAQVCGTENVLGNQNSLSFLFGLIIIPSIIHIIALIFIPESPLYILYVKGDVDAMVSSITKLQGIGHVVDRLNQVQNDIDDSEILGPVGAKDVLMKKALRKPLFIAIILSLTQQISGICVLIFFSTDILHQAHFSYSSSQYLTVFSGLVNVFSTIITMSIVDKFGRRPCLLVGLAIMISASIMLFVLLYFVHIYEMASIACLNLIFLCIFGFGLSVGPVTWFITPELFNTAARTAALSIILPLNWLAKFLLVVGFNTCRGVLGPALMLVFNACQVMSFIFVWVYLPETKGRPIEEISYWFS